MGIDVGGGNSWEWLSPIPCAFMQETKGASLVVSDPEISLHASAPELTDLAATPNCQGFTVSTYLFEQCLSHLATNRCFEVIRKRGDLT